MISFIYDTECKNNYFGLGRKTLKIGAVSVLIAAIYQLGWSQECEHSPSRPSCRHVKVSCLSKKCHTLLL